MTTATATRELVKGITLTATTHLVTTAQTQATPAVRGYNII